MAKGKNINLFLMDGEVTGKIKCTLSNWAGVIYKIPRHQLSQVRDRQELKQTGIYFLIGKDDACQQDTVYIGQATSRKNGEGVLLRVQEHTRDSHADYFNDVLILTTQNNSFGPTEISYLENTFTNLAREAGRYLVRNGNEPNSGNVTEEKQSELDEVVEHTATIIGSLGYKLFVPLVKETIPTPEETSDDQFYLNRKSRKSNQVIEASCQRTSEGFVVLKGSMIDIIDSDSLPTSLVELRQKLQSSAIIKKGILQENQLFSSPSYASAFVLGMSSNGRTDWKNKQGQSLKDLENNTDN